jgi:hypothetical protein
MQEKFKLLDEIRIVHKDKNGKVLSDRVVNAGFWNRLLCKLGLKHNSMTNIGFAQTAAWILHDVDADHSVYANCDWIGIGTGTTAADPTDTGLETQKSRLAGVGTRVTTTVTNDTAQLVATFSHANDAGLTGTMAITEVGVFWASGTGTGVMLLRQVYSPADNCNWDAGDTLTVTVKIQVKQGS